MDASFLGGGGLHYEGQLAGGNGGASHVAAERGEVGDAIEGEIDER